MNTLILAAASMSNNDLIFGLGTLALVGFFLWLLFR